MGSGERQRHALTMGIVLVLPQIELDRVEAVTGKLMHVLAYADKILCCSSAKGMLDGGTRLQKAGIPCNVYGFQNTTTAAVMWASGYRFDATGVPYTSDPWIMDSMVRDLQFDYLQKCDRTHEFSTQLLMQYAVALTGPEFCPNQVEYGKRHVLLNMLRD